MDTQYKPLEEVRKNFRVSWYRCPIERKMLLELMPPSDLQGWFQAGGHLALFALTGLITAYFFSQHN